MLRRAFFGWWRKRGGERGFMDLSLSISYRRIATCTVTARVLFSGFLGVDLDEVAQTGRTTAIQHSLQNSTYV